MTERDSKGCLVYPCDHCDFKGRSFKLKEHIKNVHLGIRYHCDQCDHKATQQSSLNVHIKNKHEGVQYKCDDCYWLPKFPYPTYKISS